MTGDENRVHVIGAGVIGLSVAYELLRREVPVTVLDPGGGPAGASTPAAAGMLAPVSEVDQEDDAVLRLALDSLEGYPSFVERLEAESGIDCGFRREGTLWVAFHRDDLDELEHLGVTMAGRGFHAERVTAERLLELEPHLGPRIQGGLIVPGDLQVDPRALLRALSEAVRRRGGTIERGLTVEEIVPGARGVEALRGRSADGAQFERRTRRAVLAAGAWSCDGIRSPLRGAGVRPVKGQLLRLRGPRLLRHVIRHPDVYLVPRSDGELLVGATMEERGFETQPTAGAVYDLLRRASVVLPALYDLALEEIVVGLRPMSRDNHPLLGPTGCPGLYAATGHGRQGVLMAPASAGLVAEAVVTGESSAALEPFAVAGSPAEPAG